MVDTWLPPYLARPDRYGPMPYRKVGQSGLRLPAVSLGMWHNFGDDKPFDVQRAILRRAFDIGITHFDLANNYGPPYGSAEQNFGRHFAADFLEELPDEAVATLAGLATSPLSPLTQVIVVPGGGAVARVPDEATAFGSRRSPFNIHYLAMWPDPADSDANIAHTRTIAAAMKPWTSGAVYLNFIGDEGRERVEAAFGETKLARLREIKAVWDPDNVFHHNQNIAPAT